jgi:drug/metabolite transporter (DMT)-like permease
MQNGHSFYAIFAGFFISDNHFPMEKDLVRNHIKLHIIVFILGFTAVLGKLISMPAYQLVWFRMMIAAVTLFLMIVISRQKLLLSGKTILKLAGIGFVVAFHWITFFHAIKVSNISVTLSCLATSTLFTSFLEPLSQRRRISWLEVLVGMIIIAGIYLIYQFEAQYIEGILFSLLSFFLASVFSVLNKNIALSYNIRVIAFWEMLSGFLVVTAFMLLSGNQQGISLNISFSDLFYLILLGTICTAIAYAETIRVMKTLSAYVVVLVINLEPIYGIVLGYLIFGDSEKMTPGFYLGALVILLAVFFYPILKRKLQPTS